MGHTGTSAGYPADWDELVLGRDKIVPGMAEFEAQALCLARRRRHARVLAGGLGAGPQRAQAAVPCMDECCRKWEKAAARRKLKGEKHRHGVPVSNNAPATPADR